MVAAVATVVNVFVFIVRDNPSAEGVAVVSAGSGTGMMEESLSRATVG